MMKRYHAYPSYLVVSHLSGKKHSYLSQLLAHIFRPAQLIRSRGKVSVTVPVVIRINENEIQKTRYYL